MKISLSKFKLKIFQNGNKVNTFLFKNSKLLLRKFIPALSKTENISIRRYFQTVERTKTFFVQHQFKGNFYSKNTYFPQWWVFEKKMVRYHSYQILIKSVSFLVTASVRETKKK